MSEVLSFAEACRQHVELLPARTVLSMFMKADDPSTGGTESGDAVNVLLGPVLKGVMPH
jgi:hypothetical protein